MKNYLLDESQSRTFIETYELCSDKIILHLGTGEKYTISNTNDNLNKVKDMMRSQVKNAQKEVKKLKHRGKKQHLVQRMTAFIAIISAVCGITLYAATSIAPVMLCLLGTVTISGAAVSLVAKQKEQKTLAILNDIQKNDIFTKIEADLNKSLAQGNPNILSNVSKKTKKKVAVSSTSQLELNDIHDMPLEDLKTLRANLTRMSDFGFAGDDLSQTGTEPEKSISLLPQGKNQ